MMVTVTAFYWIYWVAA